MPPPRVTKAFVTSQVTAFKANLDRARSLYKKIVLHGYTGTSAATSVRLTNPDTRDAAQFIFFEVAAKFEEFAKTMFQVEVRSVLKVTVKQSPFVMGDPDQGLNNKLGWGSPQRLKERGANILGSSSFFATLHPTLGAATYNHLVAAHMVRNRIAHSGGQAKAKFVKHLAADGIPTSERQGMSVGRYIRDYPAVASNTNKYFFVYLRAYEHFANAAMAALP
jgi:hypothetical protein